MENETKIKKVLLHAPNVHIGGGLTLLKEILETGTLLVSSAQLDFRMKEKINVPAKIKVHYVKPTIFSRFMAERRLYNEVTPDTIVLCFHGLPPLFRLRAKTVVFVQNRLLCEKGPLNQFPFKTKIRLYVERLWLRKVNPMIRYIVQTESMAMQLKKSLNSNINVTVFPFAPENKGQNISNTLDKQFDFIYVASGEAHKNHLNLLKAWCLLAEQGVKPSLVLTVDEIKYADLSSKIKQCKENFGLQLSNFGEIASHEALNNLYQSSSALIFPSLTESFGLPLLESLHHNLPILAPELDYVRDVVEPFTTFDAHSPISIARAVRRFLGIKEATMIIHDGDNFWKEIAK
jgi:glycosyltransferase involved in cell wall biosynthesis